MLLLKSCGSDPTKFSWCVLKVITSGLKKIKLRKRRKQRRGRKNKILIWNKNDSKGRQEMFFSLAKCISLKNKSC